MKKLIILLVTCLAVTFQAQAQDAITKYFDKYMDDERFSMVYISSAMFSMMQDIELEGDDVDQEVIEMLKELKGIRVLTSDAPEAGEFYKEAKSHVDMNNYEELVVARGDDGENVHIMAKNNGSTISELFVLVGSSDEFAMISIIGNIDLNKVSSLGKMLNMHGMKHLQELDKNHDGDHNKDDDH